MMPHVDDGTLHALLDGALRAESPERAAEAEAHLVGCVDCRARLDAAAGLRDHAGRILDEAVPDPVPAVPDFADVRARAGQAVGGGVARSAGAAPGAGGRAGVARQARWTRGLAWAATLVVALGTGYLIRDLGGPAVVGESDAVGADPGAHEAAVGEPAAQAPPPDRADDADPEAYPTVGELDGVGTRGRTALAAPPSGDAAVEEAEAMAAPPPSPAAAAKVVAGDEGEMGPPLETAEPTAGGLAAAPAVAPEAAAADEAAAAADLSARSDAASRLSAQSFAVPERQEGRWVAVDTAGAADALGGSLYVLPRATLVEVYRARDADAPEVLTLQRLASGIMVRVVQRPDPGTAAETAEADRAAPQPDPAPRGDAANLPSASTVTVRRDGFVLELTGSLPGELLVILGESARPAG